MRPFKAGSIQCNAGMGKNDPSSLKNGQPKKLGPQRNVLVPSQNGQSFIHKKLQSRWNLATLLIVFKKTILDQKDRSRQMLTFSIEKFGFDPVRLFYKYMGELLCCFSGPVAISHDIFWHNSGHLVQKHPTWSVAISFTNSLYRFSSAAHMAKEYTVDSQ